MKAAVFRKGKGLVVEELTMPDIDKDQVLIQVANTGFCGSDHSMIEDGGAPDGTVFGHEMAGTVIEKGTDVTGAKTGLRVMLRPTYCDSCPGCRSGRFQLCSNNRRSIGIGDLSGGFAEYVIAYPQMMIPIPDNKEAELYASYGNTHAENIQCLKWISGGILDPRPLISDWCTLDELPDVYRERIDSGRAIKVMLKIGPEF